MSENIFDREIDDAWTQFQDRLTRYVRAMQDDDELVLVSRYDSTDDGLTETAACVRFFAWAGDTVRCEVPSNLFLHPARQLSEEDHDRLIELGWNRPDAVADVDEGNGSASFYLDADRTEATRLATMTIAVFREIWDLMHPSFLQAITRGRQDVPPLDLPDETPARQRNGSGLRELVDTAVESMLGQAPEKDGDGDILVWVGDMPTYVRVLDDDARVEVFARVVHSISDRTRAAEALADLNRQWSDIKFLLIVDNVVAVMRIDGSPFAAEHLLSVFRTFEHLVDTADEAFAERLGGTLNTTATSPTGTDEHGSHELPAALMTLIHLDSDSGLDADDVAEICGRDRDTILEFLRLCSDQEVEWRHNAELARENDSEEADMCESEAQSWAKTSDSLRAALRVVVLPHRAPPGGGYRSLG
ncbi:hypothetical protein R4282_23500 [Rhodococcus oxybenzonivorans]|uniref:T3SS (YopN, CesT) and YbjN peptide-binding chaperone 1 n=1 Tax=Rhodococcus oxybenzonivorans TaxID=1990687 RepID=UPI002955ABAB|nr:hypothetical protein [Rhodococcus oxybenzonivorans]MDV7355966.1 hypothetical protein [Rhodococcus oxybenzonivorans]